MDAIVQQLRDTDRQAPAEPRFLEELDFVEQDRRGLPRDVRPHRNRNGGQPLSGMGDDPALVVAIIDLRFQGQDLLA
jgi:hypothetical protein